MIYRYKKSLVDKEQFIELKKNEISITEFNKIQKIPFQSIKKILLKYNNSNYKRKEYICKIITDLGYNFTFSSKFYSGIGNFYDQGSEYRNFILALHKGISDEKRDILYIGGIKPFFYWSGIVVSVGLLVLFTYLLFSFFGIMGIILPVICMIKFIGYFYHNRPVKYNPVRIPSRLIPYE